MRTVWHVRKAISDLLQRHICRDHLAIGTFDADAKRSKLARQRIVALGRFYQVDAEFGQALAQRLLINVCQLGRIAQTDQRIGRDASFGLQVEQRIACIDRFFYDRAQTTHNGAASDRSTETGHCTLQAAKARCSVLGLPLQALH